MKTITFIKVVASGNDFILLDARKKPPPAFLKESAKKFCSRKFGIGADGLLVVERSKLADIKMRILNPDGSEAEMCGNGARSAAYYVSRENKKATGLTIETKAGILSARVHADDIRLHMTNPSKITLDNSLKLNGHALRYSFINTGVPHAVILCQVVEGMNVHSLGRLIRYHKKFQPAGTNVDFFEPIALDRIKIRTYERGVEQETLACGTGSVAAACIYSYKLQRAGLASGDDFVIKVETASGEVLTVSFRCSKGVAKDVWLIGKARIIGKGEYYA